jgi:hypothetical protein
MRNFLILALSVLAGTGRAETKTSEIEEAIILNQELQFLEDSVKQVQARSINVSDDKAKDRALNSHSLEKQFFGEGLEEDVVTTRSAGQKRRGL